MLIYSMINVPINAITWLVGSIPTLIYSVKCYSVYRSSKNPVALGYSIFMFFISMCLLFFGLPALLTQNFDTLQKTSFIANVFLQIGLLVLLWLAWLLIFRKKVNLLLIMAVGIIYSLVILFNSYSSIHVFITNPPRIIHYVNTTAVLFMQSVMLMCLAVPLGFYFLWQSSYQKDSLTRARTIVTGLLFITVSLAATSTNVLNNGSDNFVSTMTELFFFALFLIVLIIPKSVSSKLSASLHLRK